MGTRRLPPRLSRSRARASNRKLDFRGAPEVPGADAAVGAPGLGQALEAHGLRQFAQAVDPLRAPADAVVAHREDVRPSQRKNEQHVRGPLADATHLGDGLDDLRVFHAKEAPAVQGPCGEGLGQGPQGRDLLAGQTHGPQRPVRGGRQRLRSGVLAAVARPQPPGDRAGRAALELLEDDGTNQRTVGVPLGANPARTRGADHTGKPAIAPDQHPARPLPQLSVEALGHGRAA